MFAPTTRIDYDIRTYRYHRKETTDNYTKAKIAAGAVAGAVIPTLLLAKRQNVKFHNVKYGLKEMFITGSSSIAAGTLSGIIFDKKHDKKQKLHEGVFQFMNSSVPMFLTAGIYSIGNKVKILNNKWFKVLGTVVGVLGGINLAAKLSNKINDPYDKVPDRKLTLKDSIANIDDAVGVLVMAKVPFAQKLHIEKFLALIYALCGYRSGSSS